MAHIQRNFFEPPALIKSNLRVHAPVAHPQPLSALRSLPGVCLDAIPRRFSSSSLPPLFVLGRFAGFSFSTGRALPQGSGV